MILDNGYEEDREEVYSIKKDPEGVMGPRLDVTILNNLEEVSDTAEDYSDMARIIRWSDDEFESMVDEIYSAISDVLGDDSIRSPGKYTKTGLGQGYRNIRKLHDVLTYDSMDGILRYDRGKVISRINEDDVIVPDSFDITMDFYRSGTETSEKVDSKAENLLERFRRIGESY